MEPILKTGEHSMIPVQNAAKSHAAEPEKITADAPDKQKKPSVDTYTPEEEHVPSGLYRMGRDEKGNPKVYFDDPEQTDNPSDSKPADGASDAKPSSDPEDTKKTESCTGNTDKVDREIKQLKKKQQELKQQIRMEKDEKKTESLEKKLAQVESELRQKDNDAYRRQHTVFS